jgi:hypothetical protein
LAKKLGFSESSLNRSPKKNRWISGFRRPIWTSWRRGSIACALRWYLT